MFGQSEIEDKPRTKKRNLWWWKGNGMIPNIFTNGKRGSKHEINRNDS